MLRQAALAALAADDLTARLALTEALAGMGPVGAEEVLEARLPLPGPLPRPRLVDPGQLPKRGLGTAEGRAVLFHALAHIELSAVNLGLDIVWRFPGLPEDFYRDWIQVAREEVDHFRLLNAHLGTLGYGYGDFPAHNGLWEMAEKTRDDVLARLALIPCTLEARGLDVSPAMKAKLLQAGDEAGAALLDIILRDEIGHVAFGLRWFHALCKDRGVDPWPTYRELLSRYGAPALHGPFNVEARLQAGFPEAAPWGLHPQARP